MRTTSSASRTTSRPSPQQPSVSCEAPAAELGRHIRGHWLIENRSHYVRDRTFDEDRSQTRVGGAPQARATLRNLAISLLRLAGFKNIASGLRWMAFDRRRSFALLGL